MGDDIKEAPEGKPLNEADTKLAEKLIEDEQNLDTSEAEKSEKEQGAKGKKEEKPADGEKAEEKTAKKDPKKKEESGVEVDSESMKIELEELRSLKGKLGSKIGLLERERDLYRKQIEDSQEKKDIAKVEDEFEKLRNITDPSEYAKAVVALSTKKAEAKADEKLAVARADLKKRTKVWNKLISKYPDLKDPSSEMSKQTDALMIAKGIRIEGADLAAGYVDSQLKLAEMGKKKEEIVADLKGKKIKKTKQGGLKQPSAKVKSSPEWDKMSDEKKSVAQKLGLTSEDYEEETDV